MAMKYLLDTNIIIYHLNGLLNDKTQISINSMLTLDLQLSIITKIELLGFKFTSQKQKLSTQMFVDNVNWILLTIAIADQAILLRQEYKIKTPDAILAATAILGDYTLVSHNDKDFKKIVSLKYLNPFS